MTTERRASLTIGVAPNRRNRLQFLSKRPVNLGRRFDQVSGQPSTLVQTQSCRTNHWLLTDVRKQNHKS